MSRFSILPIFRGHWRGLTNDLADGTTAPDWPVRITLVAVAAAVLVCSYILGWQIASPSATLSAMALLSAGLLGVFTQLSSLRIRLTDRPDEAWLDVERDGIDEAVAHVLFAFLLCISSGALLVIGMNLVAWYRPGTPELDRWWSGPVLAIGAYIVMTFLILVPKLYAAYTEMNSVRNELNGFHRRRR